MSRRIIFNPDDYLETEAGRVYTPERSNAAWQQAYEDLSAALEAADEGAELYVVVGVQGAGKTTWIERHRDRLGDAALFFDAALPARIHRERVLAHALRSGVPAVAVWIDVPLEVALSRNRRRREDHQVPDAALRSVFAMLEQPTVEEGFARVIVDVGVDAAASR